MATAGTAQPTDTPAGARAALVEAVHSQTLAETARTLESETPNSGVAAEARRAREVCARISREMLELGQSIQAALAKRGVVADLNDSGARAGRRQYHSIGLEIARGDLATALAVAASRGFAPPIGLGRGRRAALAALGDGVTLVRQDGKTTRLVLQLAGKAPLPLPARLRPGFGDLARLDLPGVLWPLYLAVKPARVLAERLMRRRRPATDIDFLGTPDDLVGPLLELAGLGSGDVLMDVGCGDGRILVDAVRRTGCRAIGIEVNPDLAARARKAAGDAGLSDRIEVREADSEDADFSEAGVIFLFLPNFLALRLLPRILARAAPGTRVIAHEQARIPGLPEPHDRHLVLGDASLTVARLWRVPPA